MLVFIWILIKSVICNEYIENRDAGSRIKNIKLEEVGHYIYLNSGILMEFSKDEEFLIVDKLSV